MYEVRNTSKDGLIATNDFYFTLILNCKIFC